MRTSIHASILPVLLVLCGAGVASASSLNQLEGKGVAPHKRALVNNHLEQQSLVGRDSAVSAGSKMVLVKKRDEAAGTELDKRTDDPFAVAEALLKLCPFPIPDPFLVIKVVLKAFNFPLAGSGIPSVPSVPGVPSPSVPGIPSVPSTLTGPENPFLVAEALLKLCPFPIPDPFLVIKICLKAFNIPFVLPGGHSAAAVSDAVDKAAHDLSKRDGPLGPLSAVTGLLNNLPLPLSLLGGSTAPAAPAGPADPAGPGGPPTDPGAPPTDPGTPPTDPGTPPAPPTDPGTPPTPPTDPGTPPAPAPAPAPAPPPAAKEA